MPISVITGLFARVWSFVDQFSADEEVRRSDLDTALDDFVPAINAALAIQTTAERALAYSGKSFSSRAALTADLTLTYATGDVGSILAGDIISIQSTRESYVILDPAATTWDLITAGAVKLQYVLGAKEATTPIGFSSTAALLADTSLTYDPGPLGPVDPGAFILTLADLRVYEVAPDDATTHTHTTAGGVKLFLKLSSFGGPHVILEDRKASGTNGGTFTNSADQKRDLNTEVLDAFGICALASSQFTLPAGTYVIEFRAPVGSAVGAHQAKLYNATAGAVVFRGSTAPTGAPSMGCGVVTVAASTIFEIRHRCTTTQADTGFGAPASFGTEVFTQVKISKVQ